LIASSGAGNAAAVDLFFFLEEEELSDEDDLGSELNHTPMDRNRDLALPLPLPAGSCCDHAGLGAADRRSGLPADDDEIFLRWSRPAMLPHLHTHHSKQSTTNGRRRRRTVYIEEDKRCDRVLGRPARQQRP
jgi:hypothetical protein